MALLDDIVQRVWGPWCQSNHESGPTCWKRVPLDQPGHICDECWNRLTSPETDITDRADLAREPDLPPDVVDRLVDDVAASVRAALAENEQALLEEHVDALAARTSDTRVLMRLARRPDLTYDQQIMLSNAEAPQVRNVLVGNMVCDPAIRQRIAGY